ncbi:hypothetical protein HTZ84_05145 [Haloterrigena sp. SYSU A558-1]|uniref:Phage head morphogenesis domain-containing protein n=1 Tax=Haloterrigena gelatinilytica TaxID=2741724 RepID=A0ABX2LF12_9EURY|nr:hypothetical protein [Haloterrigena gelatinilytica]NUC71699.1 hypothetical protein [Haloterrigena gelatinilytica]
MPSEDPTQSTTRRRKWTGRFNKRYEAIVGALNDEFRGGSEFRPQNDVEESLQTADFREWFEQQLDDEVVEPLPSRAVRNGAHYTADYVDEFYRTGLRLADEDIRQAGADIPDVSPAVVASSDIHQKKLRGEYVEVYQELEDIARETGRQATREYRGAVAGSETLAATLSALKDRVRKVGESRTKNLAHSYGTRIVNDAIVERAAELGVEQIGVDVETDITIDGEPLEQWQAVLDEVTCDQCRALHGNAYKVSEIRSGDAPRPVDDTHAYCRCRYIIVEI